MDKTVTIATHVGPLVTQIRETDTVLSFLEELKESLSRNSPGQYAPSWHLLLYKSRILPLQAKLAEVLDDPDEGLVYVHPTQKALTRNMASPNLENCDDGPLSCLLTQIKDAPHKPRPAFKPSIPQMSPLQSPLSTNASITSTTSNRSNRRSSVSIVPSSMPPATYFESGSLQGLESMGFSELRAMQALLICQNKFDPALDWLLALQLSDDSTPLEANDQEALNEALAKYRLTHVNSR